MDQIATNHGQREGLRDPVCGMATTTESEHQAIHDGETYYFCCARCVEKFTSSPNAYLAAGPAEHHAHPHAGSANAGGSLPGPTSARCVRRFARTTPPPAPSVVWRSSGRLLRRTNNPQRTRGLRALETTITSVCGVAACAPRGLMSRANTAPVRESSTRGMSARPTERACGRALISC